MPRGRPRINISPCRFCNAQFKRLEHLRRHERIHTNEKPFSCDCGHNFSRQDLLVRHTRIAHPPSSANSKGLCDAGVGVPSITDTCIVDDLPQNMVDASSSTTADEVSASIFSAQSYTSPGITTPLHAITPVPEVGQGASDLNQLQGNFYQLSSHQDTQSDVTGFPFSNDNDFDFLWSHSSNSREFLPTTFFDTDHGLFDLWQPDGELIAPSEASNLEPSDSHCSGNSNLDLVSGSSKAFRPLTALEAAAHHPNVEKLPADNLYGDQSEEINPVSISGSPWSISNSTYTILRDKILLFKSTIPAEFNIPSKYTLSRYFGGYFRDFHKNFPFLHPPTLTPESLSPELILAIAAVGAFYRFERTQGYELYFAAKAVVAEQMRNRSKSSIANLMATHPGNSKSSQTQASLHSFAGIPTSSTTASPPQTIGYPQLHTMQATVLLVAIASWADAPIVQDALLMSSQLAMLVREAGISRDDNIKEGTPWHEWIAREVHRRTLFVAYILFNLQSIAFDVPPLILNRDIGISLPHCGSEWEATTSEAWSELRQMYGHNESRFQEVFSKLLSGQEIHKEGPFSALGNYVLMSGLLQQIFLDRHTLECLSTHSSSLSTSSIKTFEIALQKWQLSWESTQESSLDPTSSKGPLGFNAVAMLRLAYIRINANLGPHRSLVSRDPQCIAQIMVDDTTPQFLRSPHTDRAILQCVHALSVPIFSGITYVANTQALSWSVELAISNLECASLICRWLYMIAGVIEQPIAEALRDDERKLLGMVFSLVKETPLASNLRDFNSSAERIRGLGRIVLQLWTLTFNGVHVFNIVDAIGTSISTAAEILEARAHTSRN